MVTRHLLAIVRVHVLTAARGHVTNFRSQFVIRPHRGLSFLANFLANKLELTGKTFTTPLTSPNHHHIPTLLKHFKQTERSSDQICTRPRFLLKFWSTKVVAMRRRSGQSVTASDFGSNGPRFESGRGRCVESLDKALYSHCPKEKPSH